MTSNLNWTQETTGNEGKSYSIRDGQEGAAPPRMGLSRDNWPTCRKEAGSGENFF